MLENTTRILKALLVQTRCEMSMATTWTKQYPQAGLANHAVIATRAVHSRHAPNSSSRLQFFHQFRVM
jgi:hypothetical protein